ncbi:MAG: fimbrillin family protein [Alphaproteobacteria bacterium]|nr:fimbrillin family protein [Alphaproteobacteria bacterium]
MKTKYLAFAAAALMLASCSNDEDFVPQDNLKDAPITVTAGVEGMLTRAGHDADNLPATFYLTVTQTEEVSQYNYTNVEMTKGNGNNYTPSDNILWKDATRNPFVSAYTIEGTAFTVQTDQSTAENVIASDLLGAIKESGETSDDITITGDNIGISFRHLLCKLDVAFSWGNELATATTKTVKSVEYQGFGTDVTLDRNACTITQGETTTYIQAYVATADEGVTYLSEAIFAPQVGTAPKIVITALIDNVERIFSLNVTAPTGGFLSGNRYTMNVAIGGTTTQTGEIKISKGWETGDANGEAEGTNGNMATN